MAALPRTKRARTQGSRAKLAQVSSDKLRRCARCTACGHKGPLFSILGGPVSTLASCRSRWTRCKTRDDWTGILSRLIRSRAPERASERQPQLNRRPSARPAYRGPEEASTTRPSPEGSFLVTSARESLRHRASLGHRCLDISLARVANQIAVARKCSFDFTAVNSKRAAFIFAERPETHSHTNQIGADIRRSHDDVETTVTVPAAVIPKVHISRIRHVAQSQHGLRLPYQPKNRNA